MKVLLLSWTVRLVLSWTHQHNHAQHRSCAAFGFHLPPSAFSRPTSHKPTCKPTCLWSSSVSGFSSCAAARAGEDGYSVMRQPANWDTESDPVFDVPDSLRDDSSSFVRQPLDYEWWFQQQSKQQQQSTR